VSHDPNPLERIPAGRRQQIALVVAVVAIVGVAVGTGFVVVRMRRRRGR
jgi:LPS O-antigen subunit length determinant protein (WzzB/FepE family)